jgi:hypothetical protein
MTSKNEALQAWEVDFFWRHSVDRWEWEQDTSPEVDLLRAETERLVTRFVPVYDGPVIALPANMTDEEVQEYINDQDPFGYFEE